MFDWNELRLWLTAIGPLIIGMVVAYVAWRQWRTAKDKLAIDLFDRRVEAWTAVEHCFQDVLARAETDYLARREVSFTDTDLRNFSRIESNAHWLFGDHVRAQIEKTAHAIVALTASQVPYDAESDPEDWDHYFNSTLTKPAVIALADLRKMVEPFMMLDKMAVNRPAKPFRWFWQKQPHGSKV